MKADLELRYTHNHEYLRRLGKVHFLLQHFTKPGSNATQIWRVNSLHDFKKWGDAREFMRTEADRLGGGDVTGEENYREAWHNHIYSYALEDAAE